MHDIELELDLGAALMARLEQKAAEQRCSVEMLILRCVDAYLRERTQEESLPSGGGETGGSG